MGMKRRSWALGGVIYSKLWNAFVIITSEWSVGQPAGLLGEGIHLV